MVWVTYATIMAMGTVGDCGFATTITTIVTSETATVRDCVVVVGLTVSVVARVAKTVSFTVNNSKLPQLKGENNTATIYHTESPLSYEFRPPTSPTSALTAPVEMTPVLGVPLPSHKDSCSEKRDSSSYARGSTSGAPPTAVIAHTAILHALIT